MVRADDRRDDRLDLAAQALLERGLPLVGADVAAVCIVAGTVGQELAALVDDRHPLRPQSVDGAGDEMTDGANLMRLQRAADLEHDGRGGIDLVAREQRAIGHHQMHAGVLDAVERADGAGELAFERAHVVDVLHEARGAEHLRLVEDLVTDAAALGQAAFGERHAQPGDAVLRHHHDVAVVAQLIGHGLTVELLHDRRRILIGQIGEQRRHQRRRHPHDEEDEEADQRNGDGAHGRNPRRAERFNELDQTLHRAAPLGPSDAMRRTGQDLPG